MAAVVGPSVARHPPPSPRKPIPKVSSRAATQGPDPYYGHDEIAKICARFVTHLFACPDLPPQSSTHPPAPSPPLAIFIAYALHRTRLHASVTFAALYLLQRLKARFPAARGSSGHRLFISAFMLASKVICDDTYSNKSWSIVGQGMFALREINQMEREMCSYLEWQLNVEPSQLRSFEAKVRQDFKGAGPYPTYNLPSPAPSPMPSTTPYAKATDIQQPSFMHASQKPEPAAPPPSAHPHPHTHHVAVEGAPLSPPPSPSASTPDACYSNSTSPASSLSPPTPSGPHDYSARIVEAPGSLPISSEHSSSARTVTQKPYHPSHYAASSSRPAPRRRSDESIQQPAEPVRKPKSNGELYAMAVPCVW